MLYNLQKYSDSDDPIEYAPPDSDEEMDYGSTYRACRHTQQEKQVKNDLFHEK